MTEVRRGKDGYWHIAMDERGVYIRIGPKAAGITVPASVAAEIAAALAEVTGE